MEKRKVVYQDGSYQLLKPKENGNFFPYGERKSVKGLADAFRKKRFELIMSLEIKRAIEGYIRKEEDREREYRMNNGLESKTI